MEEELLAIYVAVALAMYKDMRILDTTVKLDTKHSNIHYLLFLSLCK